MKKKVLAGVLVAVVAAVVGIHSATVLAQKAEKTWSIAVHIEYPDGFVYDHAFATGVPNSRKTEMLAECGRSHRYGSAVRFHCYPIPE
jgi:hypothetical protein